ncbi:transcription factor TFIIIB component B'' homolog isoform X2 [Gymnodraco acuticeps]|uniref:Transcription factor TFIIIB component B'' homolog isoform X2 n=1 Tax=Gymnodraco acuticeps TaxID=8218 RepID=A0A6P8W761_GYMAC|nr:transcription factor TFIIIB component B'' homolog isoform X2 [Gymnodraco acuticeps]
MFRRSRFSIRPNVGATGKTASTPQESPSASQETSETPNDVGESSTATAVTDNKPAVTPSETPTVPGDGIDQHVEGTSSSAALQRRKRFSIKPKVAPGRPSIAARKTRTPVKSASETPVSDHDKPNTSSQTGTASAPQRLQSPRRRRPSEESKQQIIQPKPTTILSEPSVIPTAEDSTENKSLLANTGKEFENISASQGNEASFRLPDKVPLSLPDKEAIAISEKARTLMSSKSRLSLSTPAFSLSRLLNDPSDLQRLAKAQKLRDLLREEMHKEKKTKRSKKREKEFDLDPAKMTMRDLIRYLPQSNPMTSSLEESVVENETVVPPSPGGQNVPEKVQEPEFVPKMPSQCEEEAEADEEEEEEEEDDDADAVMVPRVKVAEDGTLIIDEESLTVEVQRAKGPNPANERDPVFERGSTTTYSSFRKGTYCKPWSSEETDMFFLAISMVGTDFSMICQLFPLRARSEIKNKFKKEERENSWRIDKAFRERRKLDIEYFSKLLEKILEVHKNRKKLKAMAEKKPPKERKKREKGRKKAGKKLSVVEEEDEEEQKENPDLEKEGEKENEDLCNEAGTTAVKSKKKRKIKNTSTEEPKDKKNKTDKKSNEQDEAFIPGDKEAALPEDCQKSDMSEKTEGAKDGTIKPAKLSRGRAPKPLLPLGRKRVKKPPPPSTKTNDDASDKGEESVIDGVSTEQVKKDTSPSRQDQNSKSANNDHSSEEEEATAQPPKPTRYGRVPKPTKPLNYSAKEAAPASASETSPASPDASTASAARPKPKSTAKRGRSSKQQSSQESKKPKLVTLRASQSEYSDEEDEKQREEEELEEEEEHAACSPSRDSSAPVFVPAILRSPHPVISEVEETMEELDILATMPDVLGISQNALCPDDSCEWAQKETGTAEPCEHQLDLLVDVIDFLSIDHAEVSEDESYNEAAQTLLTIGNLAHLSQSAQNQIAIEDQLTGTTSDSVNETSEQLEEEVATKIDAEKENRATPVMSATSLNEVTETSETVTIVELQNIIDNNDIPILESSDQRTGSDMDPTSQLTSKTDSPPTRRARLSKVKPKPNLGQASRTAQSKSQPVTSTVRAAEESPSAAPDLSQAPCPSPALDMKPSVDLASTPTLTEELSGVSGATTSHRRASENKDISEAQFEIRREPDTRDTRPTDEDMMSHVGTSEMSCNNPLTSDTVVAEMQIGQGSNGDHPASCVKPLEELPVSEKEKGEVKSTTQTRKSRFQKIKPNPNLTQTSRSIHSKAQTSKDTLEKDSDSTPVSKFHEKTIAEPTFTTSTEKQSQSDVPHVPELTDEVLMSDVKSESRCNNPLKSKAAATDLQLGQGSIKGSVQESKDHPATCVTPVEKLPVGEKEGSEVRSTSQARKSRFQKIKPNLNLAQTSRTVRSKAQTSKDNVEKDSDLTPTTRFHEKTIAEPTFTTSTEKQSQSDVPHVPKLTDEVLMSDVKSESRCNNPLKSKAAATDLQLGQGSIKGSVQESKDHPATCVTPVEKLPVGEKEGSEVKSTSQARKSRFQKIKPNLNLAQTSRTVRSKAQTSKDNVEKDSDLTPTTRFHEKIIAEVEAEPTCTASPSEKPSHSPGPSSDCRPSLDFGITLKPTEELSTTEEKETDLEVVSGSTTTQQSASETQNLSEAQFERSRGQKTRDTKPASESTEESASSVTPVIELPVSQKEASEVKSSCKTIRICLHQVKPKSNLSQMSRTAHSKPQVTKDPYLPMPQAETCSSPTSRPNLPEKTTAEAQPSCSTIPSEQPSHSTASVSVQSLELDSTPKTIEQNKNVACELESSSEGSEQSVSQRRQRFPKVKPNLGSSLRTTRSKLQSNDICKPAEQCHMETSLTTEQQPSDNNDAGPGSQSECKQDMFFKATKTITQPTDGPTTVSDVQSSGDGSTESQIVSMQSTNTYSTPDPKESTQEPPTENDPEAPSQDAVQQSSETNETSVKSPDDKRPEPTDSPSGKAPPTRRGRLIKPKPTLGHSRRPPQHVKNTQQAEADADTSLRSSTKVIEQLSQHEPLVEVSGLSTGCTTGTQDASTSSAGGTQGHPSFTTFPDMMLPQDPSDPDEPFFILSLTEIPVSSSGEGVDSVSEPLPSLPVTDAPIEQQSVPGESLATAEEQPSPNVTVPVPMEDSNETGVIHVKDPDDGSTEGNQVDPHERTTVHPSTVQETGQNKDETEIPPTKERQTGTRRKEMAKPQVKPKMTKRKQTSKTAAAKKAESLPIQTDTTEQLELPGPSVQPEASDDTEPQRGRADHVEVEKETLTDVVDPEGTSSGAKTTRTSSRNRKAKDSDPGKAASKSPKVKTPRAKGKKSTPAAVASTPCEVTPKPGPKPGQHASEHSRLRSEQTPSTSLCPAEGSTSQPSEYMESSSLEEEPTSVSQYFLSDIFTDAESLPIQTDTTEQLELPGPSVQPEASDDTEPQRGRADHVEVEKETLTDVVDPEGTSSGAKTTRTSSRNRKAKDSDPGKAASKSPKVKTPRAKGKKSTPAAVASTPCEVTPKPGPKPGQHASEHSRLRSEQTPAEVSTSQPRIYEYMEEEPTSVSQYFLSDIFTDAEEG